MILSRNQFNRPAAGPSEASHGLLPFPCATRTVVASAAVADSRSPARGRRLRRRCRSLDRHARPRPSVTEFSTSPALPSTPYTIWWHGASAASPSRLRSPPRHRASSPSRGRSHRRWSSPRWKFLPATASIGIMAAGGATPWPGTLVVSTLGINCVPRNVANCVPSAVNLQVLATYVNCDYCQWNCKDFASWL